MADEEFVRLFAILEQQNLAAYSEKERQRLQNFYQNKPKGIEGLRPTLEIIDEV